MKKLGIILIIALTLTIVSCTRCAKAPDPSPKPDPVPDPVIEEPKPTAIARYEQVPDGVSPLTGLPYDGDGRGIMVQMENTPVARPQSGISQADLIYEMEVESRITRLTSLFLSEYPEKVGPVRSVRRQHMQLWSEWDYPYAFYGGSQEELGQNVYTLIRELNITQPRYDGLKNAALFTRAKDRKSPHNAYINLRDTVDNRYDYSPKPRSIFFNETAEISGEPATEINFSYSSNNNVHYQYDGQSSQYRRFINGDPMIDKENGEQVAVKNVIIQYANHYKVGNTVYTNIDLIGSGQAQYFTDGVVRSGLWRREGVDALTRYYDEFNNEIPFKPGVTFIQVIRSNADVEFK